MKTSQKPTARTLPLFRLARSKANSDGNRHGSDITSTPEEDCNHAGDAVESSQERGFIHQRFGCRTDASYIPTTTPGRGDEGKNPSHGNPLSHHGFMTIWQDVSGYQRQVWLERGRDYAFGSRAIIELINNQCEVLNIAIEDMKAMLQRQEKELTESDRLTSFQVQRIFKKEIESLQEHLNHRSDVDVLTKKVESKGLEIASIKSSLRTVEVVTAPTPIEQSEKTNQEVKLVELVEPEMREVEEREDYEDLELVEEDDDDENHFKRMVNEVTDENVTEGNRSKDDEPAPKSRRVEYYEPLINSRIRIVQAKLRRMEEEVKCYPYRDRRDESLGIPLDRNCAFCDAIGIHFSDACHQFRGGRTRYEIITQKK
ncbi:hypothetical protein V3C99_018172 [Haemonchus contortus]|uniref:Gag-pol polyprotein n=1 Tax=Haemonchus contortus TaxID=6289 RepID=A0A7I4Z408_HAECO|nr:unnamed protein product [Haemonchus contortus]